MANNVNASGQPYTASIKRSPPHNASRIDTGDCRRRRSPFDPAPSKIEQKRKKQRGFACDLGIGCRLKTAGRDIRKGLRFYTFSISISSSRILQNREVPLLYFFTSLYNRVPFCTTGEEKRNESRRRDRMNNCRTKGIPLNGGPSHLRALFCVVFVAATRNYDGGREPICG